VKPVFVKEVLYVAEHKRLDFDVRLDDFKKRMLEEYPMFTQDLDKAELISSLTDDRSRLGTPHRYEVEILQRASSEEDVTTFRKRMEEEIKGLECNGEMDPYLLILRQHDIEERKRLLSHLPDWEKEVRVWRRDIND